MAKDCTYKNDEECKERAIAGLYTGQGNFEMACPKHFEEQVEKHPVAVPFILDDMHEAVVDYLKDLK